MFSAYRIHKPSGWHLSAYPETSSGYPYDQVFLTTVRDDPDYRPVCDGPDGKSGAVIGFARADGGVDSLTQAYYAHHIRIPEQVAYLRFDTDTVSVQEWVVGWLRRFDDGSMERAERTIYDLPRDPYLDLADVRDAAVVQYGVEFADAPIMDSDQQLPLSPE